MRRLTNEERYLRDIRNTINPGPVFIKAALIFAALLFLLGLAAAPFLLFGGHQ